MKKTIVMTILAAMFALTTASAQFVPGKGGYGPGNGSGNQGNGPKDGTGYGARAGQKNGTGTCDGTGPSAARRAPQNRGSRR